MVGGGGGCNQPEPGARVSHGSRIVVMLGRRPLLHDFCHAWEPVTSGVFLWALQEKRGSLHEHEHMALREHMLLVLEKNFQLEEQVKLQSPGTEAGCRLAGVFSKPGCL